MLGVAQVFEGLNVLRDQVQRHEAFCPKLTGVCCVRFIRGSSHRLGVGLAVMGHPHLLISVCIVWCLLVVRLLTGPPRT